MLPVDILSPSEFISFSRPGSSAWVRRRQGVPANLLEPVIVTKTNAAEAYKNDPTLEPLTKG